MKYGDFRKKRGLGVGYTYSLDYCNRGSCPYAFALFNWGRCNSRMDREVQNSLEVWEMIGKRGEGVNKLLVAVLAIAVLAIVIFAIVPLFSKADSFLSLFKHTDNPLVRVEGNQLVGYFPGEMAVRAYDGDKWRELGDSVKIGERAFSRESLRWDFYSYYTKDNNRPAIAGRNPIWSDSSLIIDPAIIKDKPNYFSTGFLFGAENGLFLLDEQDNLFKQDDQPIEPIFNSLSLKTLDSRTFSVGNEQREEFIGTWYPVFVERDPPASAPPSSLLVWSFLKNAPFTFKFGTATKPKLEILIP